MSQASRAETDSTGVVDVQGDNPTLLVKPVLRGFLLFPLRKDNNF
jgi:hypothetical protein